jgi:hypothetical protein
MGGGGLRAALQPTQMYSGDGSAVMVVRDDIQHHVDRQHIVMMNGSSMVLHCCTWPQWDCHRGKGSKAIHQTIRLCECLVS